MPTRLAAQHRFGSFALGGAGGRRHQGVDDQPAPVLHQQMAFDDAEFHKVGVGSDSAPSNRVPG